MNGLFCGYKMRLSQYLQRIKELHGASVRLCPEHNADYYFSILSFYIRRSFICTDVNVSLRFYSEWHKRTLAPKDVVVTPYTIPYQSKKIGLNC